MGKGGVISMVWIPVFMFFTRGVIFILFAPSRETKFQVRWHLPEFELNND